MSNNDSKASGEPKRTLRRDSGAQTPAQNDGFNDGLLDSLGYEAADPTLQSPFWSEAVQAGGTAKSLR